MSPRTRRVVRGAIAAVVVVLGAVATAVTAGPPISARAAAAPIQLFGEGSWGPFREMTSWQDALLKPDSRTGSPIDLAYTNTGSKIGKGDFLDGNADFVLSGVPFTDDELSKLEHGKDDLIGAPVFATAMGFLMSLPVPEGLQIVSDLPGCNPDDPPPPSFSCTVRTPFTGDLKIPDKNLAAMMFKIAGTQGLNTWNDTDVLQSLTGQTANQFQTAGNGAPSPVLRSEADETSYYLQQYVKTRAPDVWTLVKGGHDSLWEPISEKFGQTLVASRQGVEQQTLQLGLTNLDPSSGGNSLNFFGLVGNVPPSAVPTLTDVFPHAITQFVPVKNKSGDWVKPTPDSISAGVGDGTPLYALNNDAKDAYPLVWVDYLYVPAHGLSIEKTEALATAIRYLVTAGQSSTKDAGDGHLPKALVDKALVAADQLVQSNCVGDGRAIVENSDPGAMAPDLPELKAIGKMKHCVAPPPTTTTSAPTTTTTATTGATTPTATPTTLPALTPLPLPSQTSGTSNVLPTVPSVTAPGATTTTAAPAAAAANNATKVNGALAVASLPWSAPGTEGAPDRLAAFMLGMLGFLLLRPLILRAKFPVSLAPPDLADPEAHTVGWEYGWESADPELDALVDESQSPTATPVRRILVVCVLVVVVLGGVFVLLDGPIATEWYRARQRHLAADLLVGRPHVARGETVATLQIPHIALNLSVIQGDAPEELRGGPGHRIGTPTPGKRGNSLIFGHRDAWGGPFADLGKLRKDDAIFVKGRLGDALVFLVESVQRVQENDVHLLAPSTDYRLTLITAAKNSKERLMVTAVSGTVGTLRDAFPGLRSTTPSRSGLISAAASLTLLAFAAALGAFVWLRERRYRALGVGIVVAPLLIAALLGLFLQLEMMLSPLR